MNVAELIEVLKKFPENAEIVFSGEDVGDSYSYDPVTKKTVVDTVAINLVDGSIRDISCIDADYGKCSMKVAIDIRFRYSSVIYNKV